jgi:hypothetical protein
MIEPGDVIVAALAIVVVALWLGARREIRECQRFERERRNYGRTQ